MQPIDPSYHRKNEKNPPSGSGNMSICACASTARARLGLLISQLAVFCTCDVLFYKILKQLTIGRFYLSRGPICV